MKKRLIAIMVAGIICATLLAGCKEEEETKTPTMCPVSGSVLESSEVVEKDMKLVTKYDIDYSLDQWKITDLKMINISAKLENMPKNAEVLVEHVHIDMALKSTDPYLDGLAVNSMDDSFLGYSQDGFVISETYAYNNKFAVGGFNNDLKVRWGDEYVSYDRLTESSLINIGEVYANELQVVYNLLIKYEGEKYFHTISVANEFLIPVAS